jgi:hypothetical protein
MALNKNTSAHTSHNIPEGNMVSQNRVQSALPNLPTGAAKMTIKQVVAHLNGVFPTDDVLLDGKIQMAA